MVDDGGAGDGGSGGGDGGGGDGAPAGSEKTFTQAELDRIVTERVNKSKAQFKDYGDLKAAADRLAELEAEGQTESQKLRADTEKAKQDAAAATEREQQANARVTQALVKSAVLVEAIKQGAADPEDVFKLLDGEIQVGEDGSITGADTAVKALLESKPHLLARQVPGGFGGGLQGGPAAPSSREAFNEEIRRRAGITPQ